MRLLVDIFVSASLALGITTSLRATPGIRSLNEQGIKPFACDLCMSFWGSMVGAILVHGLRLESVMIWFSAFPVAYTWLTRLTPLPPDHPDPGIPDVPDEFNESG